MKRISCIFILCTFLIILFAGASVVYAAGSMNTGFETNQLSQEEIDSFVSNVDLSLLTKEPPKETINCFDVNYKHFIAIGQQSSDTRRTVCVYSNEGVFQYGYTFDSYGDFGVEWDEDNLNIYFYRSDKIISVSPTGEIVDALEVLNNLQNNSYINHFIHSTKRKIGDTEYLIKNNLGVLNLFAASYSKLIVKNSAGAEVVIYDVESMLRFRLIAIITIVCAVVSIFIVGIVRRFIKSRRGN